MFLPLQGCLLNRCFRQQGNGLSHLLVFSRCHWRCKSSGAKACQCSCYSVDQSSQMSECVVTAVKCSRCLQTMLWPMITSWHGTDSAVLDCLCCAGLTVDDRPRTHATGRMEMPARTIVLVCHPRSTSVLRWIGHYTGLFNPGLPQLCLPQLKSMTFPGTLWGYMTCWTILHYMISRYCCDYTLHCEYSKHKHSSSFI